MFSWTCFEKHGLSCTRKSNFSSPGTSGFYFASTDLEKKTIMWFYLCKKCLQNQGLLAIQFITSRTVLYSNYTVMLNKQLFVFLMATINVTLLNKTKILGFPKKLSLLSGSFTVFVHFWLILVALFTNFSWSISIGRHECICSGYAPIPTTDTVPKDTMKLDRKNIAFLEMPNFLCPSFLH